MPALPSELVSSELPVASRAHILGIVLSVNVRAFCYFHTLLSFTFLIRAKEAHRFPVARGRRLLRLDFLHNRSVLTKGLVRVRPLTAAFFTVSDIDRRLLRAHLLRVTILVEFQIEIQ